MPKNLWFVLALCVGCEGSSTKDTASTDTSEDTSPDNPNGLGPAPVDLGSASDLASAAGYVLLAKTGITNVTGTLITGGNIGVSPNDSTSITGFTRVPETAGVVSATSVSIASPGLIYAADYNEPTPINLTSAVLSMQGAYTDAAGRSLPDFLDLSSGDLGGLTLAPGLYRWGSSVVVPTSVTIAGGADDVWIFQISDNLTVSAAQRVLLSGGASPSNIVWQVAGQVTIQENAHFEGVILSQTAVTLQTNASLSGRIYAQSMIALDDNEITAP